MNSSSRPQPTYITLDPIKVTPKYATTLTHAPLKCATNHHIIRVKQIYLRWPLLAIDASGFRVPFRAASCCSKAFDSKYSSQAAASCSICFNSHNHMQSAHLEYSKIKTNVNSYFKKVLQIASMVTVACCNYFSHILITPLAN